MIYTFYIVFQVEEKERKEEEKSTKNNKKPPQKFYNKNEMRRIQPTIDAETKKKIEKAEVTAKDKKEGIVKKRVSFICTEEDIK